jgi:hypothetical protein
MVKFSARYGIGAVVVLTEVQVALGTRTYERPQ